jgi:ankyrin repeat protein
VQKKEPTIAMATRANRRKEVEDPNNTWNMQLVVALLNSDVGAAAALVTKGANPNHVIVDATTPGAGVPNSANAPKGSMTPFLVVALRVGGIIVGVNENPNAGNITAAAIPVAEALLSLQWLSDNKGNLDAQLEGTQGTIFHWAVKHDQVDLLEKLLQLRGDITPPVVDLPVPVAAEEDGAPAVPPPPPPPPAVVMSLLVRELSTGLTPVQQAIQAAKVDVARLLLRCGAPHAFGALVDARHTQAARASRTGDISLLETLMMIGDDPYQLDAEGQSLVHIAVHHTAALDLFVDRGVSMNLRNAAGQTPLSFVVATTPNNVDICDALLQRGADANLGDAVTGLTPLMLSVMGYATDMAKKLLVDGHCDLNARDVFGATVLHWAAVARSRGILEQLLMLENVDVNAQDAQGESALHRACLVNGKEEFAAGLLAKDATNVNIVDEHGNSPLHAAVLTNNLPAIRTLIAARLDENALDGRPATPPVVTGKEAAKKASGKKEKGQPEQAVVTKLNIQLENNAKQTPLQVAIELEYEDIIVELANAGASVHRPTPYGNILHACVKQGNIKLVELLLTKQADVNHRNDRDQSPLHMAVALGDLAIVETLVKNGANVDDQDAELLMSPLHLACHGHFADIRCFLVDEGKANVDATDSAVRTALHICCAENDGAGVVHLLANGASPSSGDEDGNTPLHVACCANHHEAIAPLLERGADLWARDVTRRTPLHMAVSCGAEECVDLIAQLMIDHQEELQRSVFSPNMRSGSASSLSSIAIEDAQAKLDETSVPQEVGSDDAKPATPKIYEVGQDADAALPVVASRGASTNASKTASKVQTPASKNRSASNSNVDIARRQSAAQQEEEPQASSSNNIDGSVAVTGPVAVAATPSSRPMSTDQLRPQGVAANNEGARPVTCIAIDGAAARAAHFRNLHRNLAETDWAGGLRLKDASGRFPALLAAEGGHVGIMKKLTKTEKRLKVIIAECENGL